MRSQLSNTLKSFVLVFCLLTGLAAGAAETVDINRADAATMIENWKGIGEVKAKAIVAYRKKNGPFKSIDDLANVKGIGEGLLKKNRKLMSTSRGLSKPVGKAAAKSKKTATASTTKKASGTTTQKKAKTTAAASTSAKKSTKEQKKKSASTSKKKPAAKKQTTKKSASKKKSEQKKKPNT